MQGAKYFIKKDSEHTYLLLGEADRLKMLAECKNFADYQDYWGRVLDQNGILFKNIVRIRQIKDQDGNWMNIFKINYLQHVLPFKLRMRRKKIKPQREAMRNTSKLKKILLHNKVAINLTDMGVWEIIVTNKGSDRSHFCSGNNFTQLIENAFRDTHKASTDNEMNF